MKTTIKRVLSMALALVLLLSVFPMTALAAEHDSGSAYRQDHDKWPDQGDNKWPDKDDNKWPDKDDHKWPDKDNNRPQRPGNEDEDEKEEENTPAAPTTLTVVFKIDGEAVETDVVTPSNGKYALVQDLITYYCDIAKSETLYYKQAYNMTTGQYVNLGSSINVGEEVHIALSTNSGDQNNDQIDSTKYIHLLVKIDGNPVFEDDKIPANTTDATVNNLLVYVYGEADWATKYDLTAYNMTTKTYLNAGDKVNAGEVLHVNLTTKKAPVKTYSVKVDLNYDRKTGETLSVTEGTSMREVLKGIKNPSRMGHDFAGWYWDDDCHDRDAVKLSDKVTHDCTIYAKWVRRNVHHETILKIYLNGDVKSAAKIVDMYEYTRDGKISVDEVKEVVKKHYTAKDSDGMYFSGLFDAGNWQNYIRNNKHDGAKFIEVSRDHDTTVYVMVHNAKTYTASSSIADSSNPKTGDMIFMPAAVLGLSVSALAVLFYLNKKRAL